MIKTKLILVDGITGSGKSTTAHFIARQLEKNGIKVKWFYEVEKDHPVLEIFKNDDESDLDHSKRVFEEYPKNWIDFVNKVKDDEYVYIIESYLFQDVLMFPHFMNDLDRSVLKEYSHRILEIARCLDPVLIHFYQKDVDRSLRLNWERRGEEWTNSFIISDEKTLFCKNRNIKGKDCAIRLWQEFSDFTVELFAEYDFRKIEFENSSHDWVNYRKKILDFLDLKYFEEKLFDSSYRNYCGHYLGKGAVIRIHEKDGRLCFDCYWPNLKLIPISENEFEIEGLPIAIRFHRCENTGKKMFTFTKYLDLYKMIDGNVAEEYIPHVLSEIELEKFCGEYWCEADKLERKLYTKNGKFYYWREEGNESLLIPITDTHFMMETSAENRIDFVQVDGKWQFTFDVKGEKPVNHLFLPKITYTSTRIIKEQYTDMEWQEYFEYRTKCAELKKIGLHFKTWEELKDTTIKYLDKGSGIYMVRKDANNAGVFFLDKAYTDKPDYKHIYFSHYLIDDPITHHLLKLVLKEYLAIDPDHGFLAISSKNGEYDYLGEKLNCEIGTNQVHYELLKENIKKEVVEDWVKTYPAKFPDYTLKFYEDIPDELLDEYCDIFTELLLDMPANSMLNEPRVYPEKIKENQERNKTTNHTSYRYLIFDEKNRLIAKTNVAIDKNNPQAMHQYMTGTKKEYRCSGLGKWMKGAMILKLVADFPEFEKITTETHIENHGSKSISEQMGYKQIALFKEYKVTREKAEAFIKG